MKAVIVVAAPLNSPREPGQLRVLLRYCAAHNYRVESVVHGRVDAALAIVAAGLCDIVVALSPDPDGVPDPRVEYVRSLRRDTHGQFISDQELIRELLRRGVPADVAQQILRRPRPPGRGAS